MRSFAGVIAAAAALAAILSAQTEPEVRSLESNGRLIRYQVRGGFAVVQGDIIIGTAAEVESVRRAVNRKSLEPLSSVLLFNTASPQQWPNATMPYVIDPDIPNPQRILDGIAHWNTKTQFHIVPRNTEANYVHFVRSTTLDAACSSYLGMVGGGQAIATTDNCPTGSVIHELGHAWGLEHEQVRSDRNGNVTVLYQNMDKRFMYNFDQALTTSKDAGYYDFDSIMHYPATGFTRNGQDSMETVPVGIPIGQRNGLSAGDIDGISRAYNLIPTATTITTVPAGLPITVDGVAATSPASFDWAVGSTHTIAVAAQAGTADPRYAFVRWSDGGDPSHTITAAANQTVFCAVYQTRHRFSFDIASGSGAVSATPVSADGYYPERQPVRVTATPSAGSQFVRWTGTTNLQASGNSVSAADATVEVLLPNSQFVATFSTLPLTTIGSSPQGLTIAVDGTILSDPGALRLGRGQHAHAQSGRQPDRRQQHRALPAHRLGKRKHRHFAHRHGRQCRRFVHGEFLHQISADHRNHRGRHRHRLPVLPGRLLRRRQQGATHRRPQFRLHPALLVGRFVRRHASAIRHHGRSARCHGVLRHAASFQHLQRRQLLSPRRSSTAPDSPWRRARSSPSSPAAPPSDRHR